MAFNYSEFKKTKANSTKAEKPATKWIQWVKCGIVMALYLLFLYWVGSWMGLIVVPFIYDIYITKYIRWTWWKDLESDTGRFIMSWVDAIVFALVAVYFVNNFFFQNYVIPSSSLEKSLLTGDYLLVSKVSYGPRIPQTPLTMPLTQHTLPVFNCRSYVEWPQWEYRRVKGLGKVELGDIVVFNYPAGDTLALGIQDHDFAGTCIELAEEYALEQGYTLPDKRQMTAEEQWNNYEQMYAVGKQIIKNDPARFGDIVSRPADRRENYVKRCVGLPGQTLEIRDKIVYNDGVKMATPVNAQFTYLVYANEDLMEPKFDVWFAELEISDEQRSTWNKTRPRLADGTNFNLGIMPLTNAAVEKLSQCTAVDSIVEFIDDETSNLFPLNHDYGWTRDNYGPVWIPAKGQSISLNMDNIAIYAKAIRTYEGNSLEIKQGKIYINGEVADSYTFKMDYYWMMGDNRHNSADSRYWGFVPEDHVVGKPMFVWLSVSPDSNTKHFMHIRWNRLFKGVETLSKEIF